MIEVPTKQAAREEAEKLRIVSPRIEQERETLAVSLPLVVALCVISAVVGGTGTILLAGGEKASKTTFPAVDATGPTTLREAAQAHWRDRQAAVQAEIDAQTPEDDGYWEEYFRNVTVATEIGENMKEGHVKWIWKLGYQMAMDDYVLDEEDGEQMPLDPEELAWKFNGDPIVFAPHEDDHVMRWKLKMRSHGGVNSPICWLTVRCDRKFDRDLCYRFDEEWDRMQRAGMPLDSHRQIFDMLEPLQQIVRSYRSSGEPPAWHDEPSLRGDLEGMTFSSLFNDDFDVGGEVSMMQVQISMETELYDYRLIMLEEYDPHMNDTGTHITLSFQAKEAALAGTN
ncbi:MAG: hypothetical protein ACF8NJ_01965 [Phycisphaerales bacterium JB038]